MRAEHGEGFDETKGYDEREWSEAVPVLCRVRLGGGEKSKVRGRQDGRIVDTCLRSFEGDAAKDWFELDESSAYRASSNISSRERCASMLLRDRDGGLLIGEISFRALGRSSILLGNSGEDFSSGTAELPV